MKTAKHFLALFSAILVCISTVGCKKSAPEQSSLSDVNYEIIVSETETVYEESSSSDSAVQSTESKSEAASSETASKKKKKASESTATKSSTESSSKSKGTASKVTTNAVGIKANELELTGKDKLKQAGYTLLADNIKGEIVDVAYKDTVLLSDGTVLCGFVTGSKTYSSGLRYNVCKPEQKIVKFLSSNTRYCINENFEVFSLDLESGKCTIDSSGTQKLAKLKPFVSSAEQIVFGHYNYKFFYYYSNNKIYELNSDKNEPELCFSFPEGEKIQRTKSTDLTPICKTNKGYYTVENCLIEGEFVDSEEHYELKACPINLPDIDGDFYFISIGNGQDYAYVIWENGLYRGRVYF